MVLPVSVKELSGGMPRLDGQKTKTCKFHKLMCSPSKFICMPSIWVNITFWINGRSKSIWIWRFRRADTLAVACRITVHPSSLTSVFWARILYVSVFHWRGGNPFCLFMRSSTILKRSYHGFKKRQKEWNFQANYKKKNTFIDVVTIFSTLLKYRWYKPLACCFMCNTLCNGIAFKISVIWNTVSKAK